MGIVGNANLCRVRMVEQQMPARNRTHINNIARMTLKISHQKSVQSRRFYRTNSYALAQLTLLFSTISLAPYTRVQGQLKISTEFLFLYYEI